MDVSLQKILLLLLVSLFSACMSEQDIQPTPTQAHTPIITITSTHPSATSTPQPRLAPLNYGPEADDFPAGINPLTGRAVEDPSLLDLPAVLVSISNMPVTARPQAGPGFAPWIFELYIGEGTTRFMGVFYGDVPREIPNIKGECNVRAEIMHPKGNWIGNRVWLDENENGQQDAWRSEERRVGKECR